jgi:prepilin-type N-terminal cleavage/methylation domain-containing protein
MATIVTKDYPLSKRLNGFTLAELLVVLAVLAVLAGLLLPALARTNKYDSVAMTCLSNHRQLALAWRLYTDDNLGNFPPNEESSTDGDNYVGWVMGWLNYNGGGSVAGLSGTDDTNLTILINPKYACLGSYIKNVGVYKCPADKSCQFGKTGAPRVRSCSMNAAVGPNSFGTTAGQGGWLPSPPYWVYVKESDLMAPGAANTFLTIDENPDSINDGCFASAMAPTAGWVDFPSPLHDGSTGLSFCDGHCEMHHWMHLNNMAGVSYVSIASYPSIYPNSDLAWLQQRTSALQP